MFIKKLTSNSKSKAKQGFIYKMTLFQLSQQLIPYSSARVLPVGIDRLSPIEEMASPQMTNIPRTKVAKELIILLCNLIMIS